MADSIAQPVLRIPSAQLLLCLAKGEAIAAVLAEHVWAIALEDAVARSGGTPVASEFVDATALAESLPEQS